MPIWIFFVRKMTPARLFLLLIVQIAFDFWSSYLASPSDDIFWRWRLNWLVLHYVFVFILGGVLATHSEKFFSWISSRKKIISATFFVSLIILLGFYYFLIDFRGYSPLEAVNTAHQLSPPGIFYTIAASIFFFSLFEGKLPVPLKKLLSLLGKNSYFVYLAHPMAITYLSLAMSKLNLVMTARNALIFYFLIVAITLAVKLTFQKVFQAIRR